MDNGTNTPGFTDREVGGGNQSKQDALQRRPNDATRITGIALLDAKPERVGDHFETKMALQTADKQTRDYVGRGKDELSALINACELARADLQEVGNRANAHRGDAAGAWPQNEVPAR